MGKKVKFSEIQPVVLPNVSKRPMRKMLEPYVVGMGLGDVYRFDLTSDKVHKQNAFKVLISLSIKEEDRRDNNQAFYVWSGGNWIAIECVYAERKDFPYV